MPLAGLPPATDPPALSGLSRGSAAGATLKLVVRLLGILACLLATAPPAEPCLLSASSLLATLPSLACLARCLAIDSDV